MASKDPSLEFAKFLEFSDLQQYDERDGNKCVGVFRYRLYEDENGIYAMHDSSWDNTKHDNSVLREVEMLTAIIINATNQTLMAVDPEQNEFDDLNASKNQTVQ